MGQSPFYVRERDREHLGRKIGAQKIGHSMNSHVRALISLTTVVHLRLVEQLFFYQDMLSCLAGKLAANSVHSSNSPLINFVCEKVSCPAIWNLSIHHKSDDHRKKLSVGVTSFTSYHNLCNLLASRGGGFNLKTLVTVHLRVVSLSWVELTSGSVLAGTNFFRSPLPGWEQVTL